MSILRGGAILALLHIVAHILLPWLPCWAVLGAGCAALKHTHTQTTQRGQSHV